MSGSKRMVLVSGWVVRGPWLYPFESLDAFTEAVRKRYPGKEYRLERQYNGAAVLWVRGEGGFSYYEADMRDGALPDET